MMHNRASIFTSMSALSLGVALVSTVSLDALKKMELMRQIGDETLSAQEFLKDVDEIRPPDDATCIWNCDQTSRFIREDLKRRLEQPPQPLKRDPRIDRLGQI